MEDLPLHMDRKVLIAIAVIVAIVLVCLLCGALNYCLGRRREDSSDHDGHVCMSDSSSCLGSDFSLATTADDQEAAVPASRPATGAWRH